MTGVNSRLWLCRKLQHYKYHAGSSIIIIHLRIALGSIDPEDLKLR